MEHNDVLGWVPGSPPSVWTLSPTSAARPSGNRALATPARPIVGSFVGAADRSSVYWYTPGTTPEVMFAVR